jgi:hypothetical protein
MTLWPVAAPLYPVPRVRVLYPNHLDYSEPLDDSVAGSGALIPGPKSESLVS